jgi:hypothetical protein
MIFLKSIRALLAAALLGVSLSPLAAGAVNYESHIETVNQTDKWAWMTAYKDEIIGPVTTGRKSIDGAWCVPPHTTNTHGHNVYIVKVRVEITQNANCAHPVLYDDTFSTWSVHAPRVLPQLRINTATDKSGKPIYTVHTTMR